MHKKIFAIEQHQDFKATSLIDDIGIILEWECSNNVVAARK